MGIILSSKLIDAGNHQGIWHICPGCKQRHLIYETNPHNGHKWTWDGNVNEPTFCPSVNISWGGFADPVDEEWMPAERCHYNITAGQIIFHPDSTHWLSGQTVPLPDFPIEDSI